MLFRDLKVGSLFREPYWEKDYFQVKIHDIVEGDNLFNCASVSRLGFYGYVEESVEVQKGKVVLDE